MPQLYPVNDDVIQVYTRVMDQHIMGYGGPIALNVEAVIGVMDVLEVENRLEVMEKVRFIYNYMLKRQREQEEHERLANKK